MKEIEEKSKNPFNLLKRKFVEFRREMCFRFKNFLNEHTRDMCFVEEEIESINERVETTKNKEVKFNQFSEIAPDILNLINDLRGENERLRAEKKFCMDGIRELYFADRDGNVELKKMIFGRFGLPFILDKN